MRMRNMIHGGLRIFRILDEEENEIFVEKSQDYDTVRHHFLITGKFFSKVKISFMISTTFEFSHQKVDTKLVECGTFQSIPNLK